jgi:DNA-binding MarR family transcriptional regulator
VDTELFERTISAYAAAIRILDPIRFQIWSDSGLTMPQARVLFTILESGDQSAGDLAERLGVAPSTITGITDRLVRQNLIQRKEDPRDRRVVRLAMTEAGARLTFEIAESSRAYLRRVFAEIPDERLAAIASALEDFARASATLHAPVEVQS